MVRKNGKIEIMRFVFCILILLYHCNTQFKGMAMRYPGGLCFTPAYRGYIGVEFFFIVTGFLFAKKLSKTDGIKSDNLGKDTIQFMWKKYASIFPVHIVAFIILFVMYAIVERYSGTALLNFFVRTLPNALLLNKTGLDVLNINHVEWYLSCMLIALFILYPIARANYSVFSKIICPIAGILMVGTSIKLNGSVVSNANTLVVSDCIFRAISEICLGVVAFELAKYFDSQTLTKGGKVLLSIAENALYLIVICYAISNADKRFDGIAVLLLTVAVAISFSSNSLHSKLSHTKFAYFLGSTSLPIYVTQLISFYIVNSFFTDKTWGFKVVFVLLNTIVVSAICKCGEIALRKTNGWVKKKIVSKKEAV